MIERRRPGKRPPCPMCQSDRSRVVDTGQTDTVTGVLERRRQCLNCRSRWTTYEHNSRAVPLEHKMWQAQTS